MLEACQARPTLTLWDYQAEAFASICRKFDGGDRSALLVLPTGCGKTVTFGAVARYVIEDVGGRVLILAHRGELLTQAADTLAAVGVESAIEKADQQARAALLDDPSCVVASVQTMQRKRLESWPRKHFKLIITDECHHAPASSYQEIYKHLDPDWHLGVTATPDRFDGENLGQVYQSVAFEYPLWRAIQERYLVRLRVVRCETAVDLSMIRTTGGDLNQGDLEEAIAPHIEELANAIRQEIGDRRTIVFTPDVGSAEAMAHALSALGMPADSISGDSRDRDEILRGFRHGRIRVLCNCNLLTEGFDAKFVSAIVLARPTKSRALYSQMVGRGTRLSPGKQDCLIIDFSWMSGKHQLVKATELFDTTQTHQETLKLAEEMIDSGEESDLMRAIERAEETRRERVKLRIQVRERDVKYHRVSYDPMAVFDVLGVPLRGESDSVLRAKATPKQVAVLMKFGIDGAADMSKRRAGMMLDRLFDRMKRGLCTVKQASWAIAKGMDPDEARAMSKQEASEFLDSVFKKRA